MKYRSLATTIFILLIAMVSEAQGIPAGANGLELSASSDYPVPGQSVTVTARSYSIDINSATVTWAINGKTEQKGTGLATLKVTAPPLGKSLDISVTAVTVEGNIVARNIKITSGSVDMIVESEGYVPTSYKGKVPVVYQNQFKIIAVPHLADSSGIEYDPKTLIYRWKKNDKTIENQSGYGKQALVLEGDIIPREMNIAVEVSNRENTAHAIGYQTIAFNSPSVVFYVDDPLYGTLWNSAISDVLQIGSQTEIGILAVPFGFNKKTNEIGDLTMTWMINGFERPEFASNQSLLLRSPGDRAGSSDVSLDIRNKKDILQSAMSGFRVRFLAKKNQ